MNQLIRKSFNSLYFSFGIYGFSREYRSIKSHDDSNRFFTDKLFCSTLNGIIYLAVPINIYYLAKLLCYCQLIKNILNGWSNLFTSKNSRISMVIYTFRRDHPLRMKKTKPNGLMPMSDH